MCAGGFSLRSQLDFHVFSMAQNGSKMDPKGILLRSKISTTLLLGGPRSDLGCHFRASESRLKNGSKKNRVDAPWGRGRRRGQAGWGGLGGA